jgi:hypothetical protein
MNFNARDVFEHYPISVGYLEERGCVSHVISFARTGRQLAVIWRRSLHQKPSPPKRLDSYALQHLGTARIIRLIAACRIDGAQQVGLAPDTDSETFSRRSPTPLF